MAMNFLEFEQPIAELEAKIEELKFLGTDASVNISEEIKRLQSKSRALTSSIFSNLSPWQITQLARHPQRPYTLDYVSMIFTDWHELHGDRMYSDDLAIVGGLARLEGLESDAGLDGFLEDALGGFRGDIFDLDAAVGRRHEGVLAGGAVEDDAQVELALDGQSFFDQEALDDAAFGSGLMGDQLHAQNFFSGGAGFLGVFDHLDASTLAASAGVDLGFDYYRTAEFLRGRFGFESCVGDFPTRHRHSVTSEQDFGLVFVDLHVDDVSGNF